MTAETVAPPPRAGTKGTPPPRPLAVRIWRNYAFKRIRQAIFTIWFVATGTFFLARLMPGDPIDIMAGRLTESGMTHAQARGIAEAIVPYDPHASWYVQYLEFMTGVVTFNYGNMMTRPSTEVTDYIMQYLPWTLFSVGLGVLIAVFVGLGVGMIMAYRRNGTFDHIMTPIASFLAGVPNYLLAAAVVVIGSTWLGLFSFANMRGRLSPGVETGFNMVFIGDALYHAILPVFAYAVTITGGWMLTMKAATTEIMTEDYVMVARARGLKGWRIGSNYIGRNAILPLMPQIALALGTLIGGAVLVERILNYPGIGGMFLESINQRDYPVIQATTIILASTVVIANLICDLLASRLDPRIRLDDTEA
ncbi:ABC transporter permease [Natronoglycomyces albus]|uniref:ABC transporter permease n=1 Tax=Natronoglycomyces albus TaxID=2811108 RepID=A0A895XJC0_9ACTN|nr:ABC transporter permease [Natronoglycomyces albus]QSB05087.1 ABC transporter permease [Natronoglycomyces albus]